MDIGYSNKKVEKLCTNYASAKKDLDIQVVEKLYSVINLIQASESLFDICKIPTYHLHQLEGDRKVQLAIDLGRRIGYRLIIVPVPKIDKEHVSLDFESKCKTIKSIQIVEVSKHYG